MAGGAPARRVGSGASNTTDSSQPGDRLDALPGELLGEFERAEQVVGVGQRQRRLPVGGRELGEVGDLQRPFEQRIGRVHVQVHEADLVQNRIDDTVHRTAHRSASGGQDSAPARRSRPGRTERPVDGRSGCRRRRERPDCDHRHQREKRNDLVRERRRPYRPLMFVFCSATVRYPLRMRRNFPQAPPDGCGNGARLRRRRREARRLSERTGARQPCGTHEERLACS